VNRQLLTGNGAAAWGVRLSRAEYIPAFPITPQTEIIETLSAWIGSGEMSARLVTLESEHSMITAAGSAAATGVRVFSATSSQGLLYAMEMIYTVAGWRMPFVLVNVSRGLSAPITLEPDHNDILAARDSGFLQLHCSTCQEVLDSILIAYRLAEDRSVRLPVMVNLDGFYLSFTRESVDIPGKDRAEAFVGHFDHENMAFRAGTPTSQAVAVLGGAPYSYFRYEMHLAAQQALAVYDLLAGEFREVFGREHPAVEAYQADDAEMVFVMIGSFATKAKEAVRQLRASGIKAGLIRPRLVRPFPSQHLLSLLKGVKGVAVVDQNISMGKGGILHTELAASIYGQPHAPALLGFIGGLGGRDIAQEEFYEMAKITLDAARSGLIPEPRMLYTADELLHVRKLQLLARAERSNRCDDHDRP